MLALSRLEYQFMFKIDEIEYRFKVFVKEKIIVCKPFESVYRSPSFIRAVSVMLCWDSAQAISASPFHIYIYIYICKQLLHNLSNANCE